ncbi:2-amino-4-hydroxy-6-hydroxymethyldihydropteridine diphosphokinase [Magnetospirillum sp. SS-4]|uniref:2-amino-4-hydroxy-6- hydroxymethyldihydropteridine diphosphokinase n=1 Tax=Magnetospirillum sp. SS-4 TaxID=2681465 RepID=UPI0013830719|nr:2-amino-4-hydroxy-6-hydroxymethyldihydropteridine diphosphokinase [Magnetospirillum sp. SS-4]CAA7626325.1 2-amino-4-hydroxy-6-hydroxymethyldihydropteridinepyrophosphokinase [Magnetospirillum sp. SS-4]
MPRAYLGLGTNLGDRAANLGEAIAALGDVLRIEEVSTVWETAPLYVTDQPAFLNMALAGETTLAPLALLDRLKDLENRLGRVASVRYGPRLIDLDILLYDDVVMDGDRLTLPHPRLAERRFALAPLAEIAATLIHPVSGRTIASLLAALPDDGDIRPVALASAFPKAL